MDIFVHYLKRNTVPYQSGCEICQARLKERESRNIIANQALRLGLIAQGQSLPTAAHRLQIEQFASNYA